MPLTQAARERFFLRFNPLDVATLLPGDEEAFLHLLLTGRIWEYRSFDARFLVPLEGAWALRYLHGTLRQSWHERMAALEVVARDDHAFWIVAAASEVPKAALREARAAQATALRAHAGRFKRGRGYAELRRKRKRAYHLFMRTALPAVRSGLDAYTIVLCRRR